ncbi:Disease resistance protein RGA2 [Dichanthelium oligosanthes]|uniref:Disease resistance protein RGA2 n=1 Tax=Dichanthelium oligosanthes TaxID=888268 RepID=A0A1E5UPA9_9POAL|nr:Disease resistance protein RGA2 [Dichanthelium oligosanthes]
MTPTNGASLVPVEPFDRDNISGQINEHIDECCKMAKDVRQALVLENLDYCIAQKYMNARIDHRETSSYPTEPKVYGRDEERDLIISKLISDESDVQNLSVLAIVGNGGVGKTTLAKVVYNHPAVLEHFDILMWVYVSVYFDQVKITRELLGHLCKNRCENTTELKELQSFLWNELKYKRVLLVMDDMWEDSKKERWNELLKPFLTNHAKGNKILVTTRKPSVARMTGAVHDLNLGGLQPPGFLCLFKECAFGDENYRGHRKLQKIGQQIVVKLKGYPLAAKTVGKLLQRKLDEEHWTRILESSEWKYQKDDNDIMPALRISYKHLPAHLQQCFSFCAVFPKNHRYDEKQLVNIWIALGYLASIDQNAQAEETGSKYLTDLIDLGFFLTESPRSSILMHDLLHDLAQLISSDECFTIQDLEPPNASRLVHHVSIITESAYYGQLDGIVRPNQCFQHEFSRTFSKLPKKNLRTLMLFGAHDLGFADTCQQEFKEIRAVRVLNMEMVYPALNSLISNIAAFINLRYLELHSFYYGLTLQLPEALCKLYHLQVLDIKHNWSADTVLPRGFNKLVNLRHFFAKEELHAQIAGVGRLIFLQDLKAFDVREEKEFCIAELGQLNELRGSIIIYNLQNVKSKKEAIMARLCDKLYLTGLHLSWRRGLTDTLECLEPPKGIEMLRIDGYRCSTPSWISSNFYLTSLRSLHLQNCMKWSTLPHPQQLPLLRELHLIFMHNMEKIEVGHLKVLELRNIRKLKQYMELEREQACVNLEVLDIEECHNLKGFPFQIASGALYERHFPRLRKLRIHDCCYGTTLPPLPLQDTLTSIDIKGVFSNYDVFQLRTGNGSSLCLEIKGHRYVQKLDETVLRFSKLKNLQELEVKNFTGLTCLAWEGLQQMTLLKKLRLLDCPKLFADNPKLFVPASVEELEFATCNITGKQLSNLMLNLPVLKTMKLRYCKGITSLVTGMLVDEQNLMAEGTCHVPPCCLMTLEKLHISFKRDPDPSMFLMTNDGLGVFQCLKEIALANVGMLLPSMISEAAPELSSCSLLPPSLLKLDITDVEDKLLISSKLSSLVELNIHQSPVLTCMEMCSCTSLRKLYIRECGMLQSIQGSQSLSLLVELEIADCSMLASVQLQPCTSLQLLSIGRCDALCRLDGPHSIPSLKQVKIYSNTSLASVELHSCRALEKLCVKECPALASWLGFQSLVSLKYLQISQCPGFVSCWLSAAEGIDREGHNFCIPLKQLDIDDRRVLAMPICRQLVALETLGISGIHYPNDEVSILNDSHEAALSILVSLKDLSFSNFKDLESLPATLHRLTSLRSLTIRSCPGIESLPKEGLPPSLELIDLFREYSDDLKELCMKMSEEEQRLSLYINGREACTLDSA